MLSNGLDTLCDSFSCVNYRGDAHTHILIKETDLQAKLKKITLRSPTGNWFSIEPDKGRKSSAQMSPLLAVGVNHKHHCACDSVIFVIRNEKLTVIYIDLKSGNPTGYANQFKSTRQFVRYALGLLEEFHSKKLAITEERYVIFYGGKSASLNKTTTIARTRKLATSLPDKAYKREVSNDAHIYLKELLN